MEEATHISTLRSPQAQFPSPQQPEHEQQPTPPAQLASMLQCTCPYTRYVLPPQRGMPPYYTQPYNFPQSSISNEERETAWSYITPIHRKIQQWHAVSRGTASSTLFVILTIIFMQLPSVIDAKYLSVLLLAYAMIGAVTWWFLIKWNQAMLQSQYRELQQVCCQEDSHIAACFHQRGYAVECEYDYFRQSFCLYLVPLYNQRSTSGHVSSATTGNIVDDTLNGSHGEVVAEPLIHHGEEAKLYIRVALYEVDWFRFWSPVTLSHFDLSSLSSMANNHATKAIHDSLDESWSDFISSVNRLSTQYNQKYRCWVLSCLCGAVFYILLPSPLVIVSDATNGFVSLVVTTIVLLFVGTVLCGICIWYYSRRLAMITQQRDQHVKEYIQQHNTKMYMEHRTVAKFWNHSIGCRNPRVVGYLYVFYPNGESPTIDAVTLSDILAGITPSSDIPPPTSTEGNGAHPKPDLTHYSYCGRTASSLHSRNTLAG